MSAFLAMQLVNLLLTVLTLGIFRFWATTRVRRYLWSHTSVHGAPLEWAGTGMELLKGAIVVFLLFGVPVSMLSFWLQTLILKRDFLTAGLIYLLLLVGILYLSGVAILRVLRYRLSRTYWQGIRGGSEERGWSFGLKYLGWAATTFLSLGLTSPWVTAKTWNALFARLSFGSLAFRARAGWTQLFRRYMISMLAALFCGVLIFLLARTTIASSDLRTPGAALSGNILIAFIAMYVVFLLLFLQYMAFLHRHLIGNTMLGAVSFHFNATAWDWLGYYIVNFLLAFLTLGFGLLLWPYRHWRFYTSHLSLIGDLDAAALQQTTTPGLRQGEGLADAFDIGAI